jgi:hypothetical protein
MLFSSLALHVAASAVSHGDAAGARRGIEERAEHLCAPGAARVRPGCCPWWRGTVCTWNVEMSTNIPIGYGKGIELSTLHWWHR